ncbi:MAG: hypothetical protein JWO08_1392 [Verrucomicrobiaceae bacterium]|nr:hypothetical protein [Verrucomicrobiaceae bacterium]
MNTSSSTEGQKLEQSQEGLGEHHADQRETSLESPKEMVYPTTHEEAAAEAAISETNPSAQD